MCIVVRMCYFLTCHCGERTFNQRFLCLSFPRRQLRKLPSSVFEHRHLIAGRHTVMARESAQFAERPQLVYKCLQPTQGRRSRPVQGQHARTTALVPCWSGVDRRPSARPRQLVSEPRLTGHSSSSSGSSVAARRTTGDLCARPSRAVSPAAGGRRLRCAGVGFAGPLPSRAGPTDWPLAPRHTG